MLLPKLDRREIPRSCNRGNYYRSNPGSPSVRGSGSCLRLCRVVFLRVIRPLADLGPPRQGQAMSAVHSAYTSFGCVGRGLFSWSYSSRGYHLMRTQNARVHLAGTIDRNIPKFIHDAPDLCIGLIPSGLTHTRRLNNTSLLHPESKGNKRR